MIIGIALGYALRRMPHIHKVETSAHYTICALLFVFGLGLGSNEALIHNIGFYGLEAVVVALLGMARKLWRSASFQPPHAKENGGRGMKGNLLLFISLLAGILIGMTGMTPHSLLDPDLPMLLLELLIIQVGMGIGSMEHLNRLFAVSAGRCCSYQHSPSQERYCSPPQPYYSSTDIRLAISSLWAVVLAITRSHQCSSVRLRQASPARQQPISLPP